MSAAANFKAAKITLIMKDLEAFVQDDYGLGKTADEALGVAWKGVDITEKLVRLSLSGLDI